VAAFLEFVQRDSGGRPVTLIGHSFGGSVAVAAYRILRERHVASIHRLVLIDALGFPKQIHFPLYINILRAPMANRLVLDLLPAKFRARYVLNRIFFNRTLVTQGRVCRYAQFYDLPGSHRALIGTAKQLGNDSEIAWLAQAVMDVDVPTLIVWGSHDSLIPGNPQAALFRKAIPKSQGPEFLETGHVPQEEMPNRAATLIEDFPQ
jgi:pimeloyl-ACP methyl ester carboxylesterase